MTLPAELVTGHPDVDAQHVNVLRLVEGLVQGEVDIQEATLNLADHLTSHFSAEEQLFGKAGYPKAALHQMEHLMFFEHFVRLRAVWLRDRTEEGRAAFVRGMHDWIRDHVLGHDVEMARWLAANKVREVAAP